MSAGTRPDPHPAPPPSSPKLAHHVQAAVQMKGNPSLPAAQPPARVPAAHVQAALAAVQKRPAGNSLIPPAPAAHVALATRPAVPAPVPNIQPLKATPSPLPAPLPHRTVAQPSFLSAALGVIAVGGATAYGTGALAGATAGSFFPVVGTIVGAVVGGVAGAVLPGWFSSSSSHPEEVVDPRATALDEFIEQLEDLGSSGRTTKGNSGLNYLRDLRRQGNLDAAEIYMNSHSIESLQKPVSVTETFSTDERSIHFDEPSTTPKPRGKGTKKITIERTETKREKNTEQKKAKKPTPAWEDYPSVTVAGRPFYIVDGYGTKSYGMSASSTGGKPLAVVLGYYEGKKAEVHVHLTPSGKKYDAHTGAHIKRKSSSGGDEYPASWPAGNVSGSPSLQSILDSGFRSWWMPGSYLTKTSKLWL